MASTITTYGGSVNVIKMAWTSDGSGDVTGVVFVDGEIHRVDTVPSGTAAPLANYDITLVDDITALDVFGSDLLNRHTSNTESVVPTLATAGSNESRSVHYGQATLTVANAGDTKSGDIYIYWR